MGVTNVDSLFATGPVYSQGAPILPFTTGTVYFVSSTTSGSSNNNPGTDATKPCATLAGAIAKCTASVGDTIVLMPGHAETISAAAGIAISTAGISIIGLGNGANRPTFTWATLASATITVTANDVLIKNIRCTSTIAALVTLFSVTGARCTFDTVDYFEDGTTDALQFILTTTAADDLRVMNCRWYRGTTAATALSQWIVLTGVDRVQILDNYCILKGFATSNPVNSIVAVVTTACVGMRVERNRFYDSNSTGNVPILTISACTGTIADNYMGTSATTTTISYNSCFAHQNFISNEVAKSGAVSPAIDTLS